MAGAACTESTGHTPPATLRVNTCRSAVTLASTSVDEHDEPVDTLQCKTRSSSHASSWISSSCWHESHDSPGMLVFQGTSRSCLNGGGDGDGRDAIRDDDEDSVDVDGDEFDCFRKRTTAFERRAQLDAYLSPTHRVLQSSDPVTVMPALTLATDYDPFSSGRTLEYNTDHVEVDIDPAAPTNVCDIALHGPWGAAPRMSE